MFRSWHCVCQIQQKEPHIVSCRSEVWSNVKVKYEIDIEINRQGSTLVLTIWASWIFCDLPRSFGKSLLVPPSSEPSSSRLPAAALLTCSSSASLELDLAKSSELLKFHCQLHFLPNTGNAFAQPDATWGRLWWGRVLGLSHKDLKHQRMIMRCLKQPRRKANCSAPSKQTHIILCGNRFAILAEQKPVIDFHVSDDDKIKAICIFLTALCLCSRVCHPRSIPIVQNKRSTCAILCVAGFTYVFSLYMFRAMCFAPVYETFLEWKHKWVSSLSSTSYIMLFIQNKKKAAFMRSTQTPRCDTAIDKQNTLIGKINRPMKHRTSSWPCTKPLRDLR